MTKLSNLLISKAGRREVVELVDIESRAAVIDECAYAVLLGLALLMVMVVMMVVMPVAVFSVLIVMLMSAGLRLLLFGGNGLYTAYPPSRCGHLVETEHPGVEYQAQVYLPVIALDDAG